ncbi:hypothetical protein JCM8547_000800, partial [Rhodosporidiobolus lusitaniae]
APSTLSQKPNVHLPLAAPSAPAHASAQSVPSAPSDRLTPIPPPPFPPSSSSRTISDATSAPLPRPGRTLIQHRIRPTQRWKLGTLSCRPLFTPPPPLPSQHGVDPSFRTQLSVAPSVQPDPDFDPPPPAPPSPFLSWEEQLEARWSDRSGSPGPHIAEEAVEIDEDANVRVFRRRHHPKRYAVLSSALQPDTDSLPLPLHPPAVASFRVDPLDGPYMWSLSNPFSREEMRRAEQEEMQERRMRKGGKRNRRVQFGTIETRTFPMGSSAPAFFDKLERILDFDLDSEDDDGEDPEEDSASSTDFASMAMRVVREERRRSKEEKRKKREEGGMEEDE